MSIEDPYVTVIEMAIELRVAKMTVYRLVNNGEIPATRIGRQFRIKRSDWDSYLANNKTWADRVRVEEVEDP